MKNYKLYSRKIDGYKSLSSHDVYVPCSDCLEFVITYKNCKLLVNINSKTHIIENAVGVSSDKRMNVIMNIFADLICKIPILEASNHGVMRLEIMLRDEDIKEKAVEGIIMPENSCNFFSSPLYLIRNIFSEYCIKNNYQPIVNTYIPSSIQRWQKLDRDKQEEIVSEKIDYFCEKNTMIDYTVTLIGNTRVEFAINKDNYPSLSKLLFEMERTLNREVKFPIEIMFTEKKDANKKRQY